ncbi:ABC transporter ATP-binding protein [Roseiflexus castenholzii]|uniref:ABC transporter ATP-binding protein n=1 Tax=Roseiflexus castenholzii TaxID=120962 RepID=UPI003C7A8441
MKHSGLRFLLPYMAPYRRHLIVGTIYALISASASAFSPALLGRAIDDVLAGIRTDRLVWYAVGLIALATTLAVFRYLLRMLTGWIAVGVSYRMSQDLFDRVLLFDQATAQSYGVGDLLSRASNDFIYIWRFYSAGFQMSMHALFLLAIGTVLMALSSPLLAALVVALLFASLGVQVGLGRVLERAFDHVQQRMARLSAFAQEHLSAMRMLAAYAQERSVVAAFQQSNEAYVRSNLDFVLRSAAIAPLPSLVVRLAAALVLGLGGALVVGGTISVGQYVQFIVYLGLLSAAAQQLSQAYERLQQGSAAAGRIGEVLRRRSRIVDAPDALAHMPSGDICFEGVGVRATGDSRWIVRGIDLRIAAGTTLGIVGATGAGKSTLLSLIGRVRDPDEGRITIGGVDIRRIRLETLRRSVVYVPQEPLLFSISVRDNITLGLTGVPDELVHRAAHAARLTNDLAQLPQGLATIVGERGATLSGGQKQRTAIARALVRDPSILLLDDALSSVDAQTAAEILRELAAAREGRTVVMVSQRMAAVRDADQIIVLHEGGIVEQGDHPSLLALNGRYAAMYRRELRQADRV